LIDYRELDRSNSRKLCQDAVTSPADVAAQAASATQTMEAEIARNGEKSAASERRRLAKAYIPSGNTRLQNIGVYVRGTRQTPCFQIPKSNNSGIHQGEATGIERRDLTIGPRA
jgi:hypothetical protein